MDWLLLDKNANILLSILSYHIVIDEPTEVTTTQNEVLNNNDGSPSMTIPTLLQSDFLSFELIERNQFGVTPIVMPPVPGTVSDAPPAATRSH